MGMQEDNNADIDMGKAWTDGRNPDVPEIRKTTQMLREDFDGIYNTMKSINTRVCVAYTALGARLTAAETDLASRPTSGSITSLTTRVSAAESDITSLKAWRAAKATASPDVSTSVSVPTAVITLGLNAPTVSGLNTILSTVISEINGIKLILRTREILAA